eukprot:m.5785 g.5785  ORF g.5785 m.5785 type:complete len:149 (-) comp5087_c1_seq1:531-977(-)
MSARVRSISLSVDYPSMEEARKPSKADIFAINSRTLLSLINHPTIHGSQSHLSDDSYLASVDSAVASTDMSVPSTPEKAPSPRLPDRSLSDRTKSPRPFASFLENVTRQRSISVGAVDTPPTLKPPKSMEDMEADSLMVLAAADSPMF